MCRNNNYGSILKIIPRVTKKKNYNNKRNLFLLSLKRPSFPTMANPTHKKLIQYNGRKKLNRFDTPPYF